MNRKQVGVRAWRLFVFLLIAPAVFSQRVIDISYQTDAKGNYTFFASNNAYCPYIITLGFTSLENASSDHPLPYHGVIQPGKTTLFQLKKQSTETAVSFKYSLGFTRGCLNAQPDTMITYALPLASGKETQAYVMENGARSMEGQSIKNWYVIRLRMKPGDTIYASRRGIVSAVVDDNAQNDAGQASAGFENYVEIFHKDCSFGHYGILRRGSALVKPGQLVEAGQAIGLVGGDSFGRGSEIRFSVYYNTTEGDVAEWMYIPLPFWIKDLGRGQLVQGAMYTCEKPPAILKQELKKTAVKPKPKAKPKHG